MKDECLSETTALITDVQRFSIHDGPGIRTTIFFKGCPLSCKWCHNPETIGFKNELMLKTKKCILCNDCISICPQNALTIKGNKIKLDRKKCDLCFQCVEICSSEALEPAGKTFTAQQLLLEGLRDFDYYGTNGGITISGGEPLSQIAFLRDFLPMAKKEALHICVETSAYWQYEKVNTLIDYIDLFLIDLKVIEENKHIELTGKSNTLIHNNIKKLLQAKKEICIRMPVIAELNAEIENLNLTSIFLKELGIKQITLLPYHSFGEYKSALLGKSTKYSSQSMTSEALTVISNFFEANHIEVISS